MTKYQQKIVTYIEEQDQKGKKGTNTCFHVQVTKYLKITKLVFIQYFQVTKSCVNFFRYLEFYFVLILQAVPPYIFNFLYIFLSQKEAKTFVYAVDVKKKKSLGFIPLSTLTIFFLSHTCGADWVPLFWKQAQLSDAVDYSLLNKIFQ